MTTFKTSPTSQSLRRQFEIWNRVVQSRQSNDGKSHAQSDEEYRAIYHELLDTCTSCVSATDSADSERELAIRVKELVTPWMNLESLRSASPDILRSLSRTIEELRNSSRLDRVTTWSSGIVFLVCFGVVFLLVIIGVNIDGGSAVRNDWEWLRMGGWIQETLKVNRSYISTAVVFACTGILAILGGYLVMRSPRTY